MNQLIPHAWKKPPPPWGVMCDTVKVQEEEESQGEETGRVSLQANLFILSPFPALLTVPVPADGETDI